MTTCASTISQFMKTLPADRRQAIEAVRQVILKNLPAGYEEGIQYGMIGYYVPHSIYPDGYHCDPSQPLPFVGLGSQKQHMALYLMCVYQDPQLLKWFQEAWKATGLKLDMGKSCVRFKKIEDVPLKVVGQVVRKVPVKKFIANYEKTRPKSAVKKKTAASRSVSSKTARKTGSRK